MLHPDPYQMNADPKHWWHCMTLYDMQGRRRDCVLDRGEGRRPLQRRLREGPSQRPDPPAQARGHREGPRRTRGEKKLES
jgi:hypothetical protein